MREPEELIIPGVFQIKFAAGARVQPGTCARPKSMSAAPSPQLGASLFTPRPAQSICRPGSFCGEQKSIFQRAFE